MHGVMHEGGGGEGGSSSVKVISLFSKQWPLEGETQVCNAQSSCGVQARKEMWW